MPEVLRAAPTDAVPRMLREPTPALDPITERMVAARLAEAEEQGRRAGEAEARAAAGEVAARAAGAVTARVDALLTELREHRAALVAASLELAHAAAELVLDQAPPPDALTVLERVREVVATLDDAPLEVRLHPDDHAVLAAVPTGDPRLELVPDPTVEPGDAVVAGRYAGADLTRAALVEAALEALAEGPG